MAPPDVVAATVQERAWGSPIWYTPSAAARKNATPGMAVADLKKKAAVALNDAQLKALIVDRSPWVQNTVTGDRYQATFSASGMAPGSKARDPIEPGYVTQQFAANQGQVQIRAAPLHRELLSQRLKRGPLADPSRWIGAPPAATA